MRSQHPRIQSFVIFLLILLLTLEHSATATLLYSSEQRADSVVYLPLITQPAPAIATIQIDGATMDFYGVSGESADELRSSLDRFGPGDFDALTEWNFQWTGCRPQGVGVEYTITVTFPQWEAPAAPDPELIRDWNRYMNALAYHEQGHVDIVLSAVPGFIETLQNVPCNEVTSTAQALLADIDEQSIQYDADTDHGATQGAIFP